MRYRKVLSKSVKLFIFLLLALVFMFALIINPYLGAIVGLLVGATNFRLFKRELDAFESRLHRFEDGLENGDSDINDYVRRMR